MAAADVTAGVCMVAHLQAGQSAKAAVCTRVPQMLYSWPDA
jgi:hypothetical protein